MLWLLKRTAFWKRRGYATAEWKFSIVDLMVVITVVAVLGAGMRLSEVYDDLEWLGWAEVVLMGGSAVLATLSVVMWSLFRTHWVLRSSGVIGVSIGLAAVKLLAERRFPAEHAVVVATHFLIQAPVLIVWLAWGPLLPRARPANSEP
jgi:hypothetical protein